MARVHVIEELCSGAEGRWRLCFQWCRYVYDDEPIQYGYRFMWRRPDGSLQAARGQARLPTIDHAIEAFEAARAAGWGDRDGDEMIAAADRLRQAGCVVDFGSGYVGWPTAEAAERGRLTPQIIDDERIIREWS